MKKYFKYWKVILVTSVIAADVFIFYIVTSETPSQYLTIAFLNIGQGDAIYIESPNHNRIMIDGGPPRAVLNELRKVMPFYVRDIDTLVVTNPDTDHYAGFIDVLNQYSIKKIVEPGTKSLSKTYQEFEKIISEKDIPKTIAKRGMKIILGAGAEIKILFPDHDVSQEKTNDGSIIAQLTFGETSVMLTGDAPNVSEEKVLAHGTNIKSTVLKAGHHGSRTSASESFIKGVAPEYAIISAGVKNRYGHPHQETLDLFEKLGIKVFGTYEKGRIIMKSDGKMFTISTEK